jgi:aminopeptidase N
MSKLKSLILILYLVATVTSMPNDVIVDGSEEEGDLMQELQAEYKQFDGGKVAEQAEKVMTDDDSLTYRLPNNTRPVRYDLWVMTDVEKEIFNFTGRVTITIRAEVETDYVVVQYRETDIKSVYLLEGGNRRELNGSKQLPYEYEFFKIQLPQMMSLNETFVIEINYGGQLHWAYEAGFYKANYTDTDSGDLVWYATTKFEPHHARHLFPCYDEPQIRAPIALSVQHDNSLETYANMPLKSRNEVPATNYVISEFEESPPMQTYLLAFLTSKFLYTPNNDVRLPQRIFAKPQSIIDGEAEYSARICGDILYKLEELLNVSYPLSKLDHAAITQFPSGAVNIIFSMGNICMLGDILWKNAKISYNLLVMHNFPAMTNK